MNGTSGIRAALAVFVAILMVTAALGIVAVSVSAAAPGFAAIGKVSPKALAAMLHDESVRVIIRSATTSTQPVLDAIADSGGRVTYAYRYMNFVAAEVPSDGLVSLAAHRAVARVVLDEIVVPSIPPPVQPVADGAGSLDSLVASTVVLNEEFLGVVDAPEVGPTNYFNSQAAGVTAGVRAASGDGENTVLAVIDTGIWAGHFLLDDGRLLGGQDFSPDVGTPFAGFNRRSNDPHGTFVAAVAAGQGAACFSATSLLVRSFELYSGTTLPTCFGTGKVVSLGGLAPKTSLVAYKVFPHTGEGVSSSIIDQAIEQAIEDKVNGIFDIEVINMSLGGAALFDGREFQEMLIDFATKTHDITFVIAAGNDGPVSMTVASPGASNRAVTVGAAQHPVNSRVFWDQNFGFGAGAQIVTSDDIQVISFSSRGPTADGRAKPDLVATGTVLLSAFHSSLVGSGGLAFGSGTSFSTPTVAGAVSLLNSAAEASGMDATPFDYKRALTRGADADLVPGYDRDERGAGYLDVEEAWEELQDANLGKIQSDLGKPPKKPVDITTDGDDREDRGRDRDDDDDDDDDHDDDDDDEGSVTLEPGFNVEVVFRASLRTNRVTLEIEDLEMEGANPFGIDSLEVYIHNAKRGGSGFDYFVDSTNVFDDTTFVITDTTVEVLGDPGAFRNDSPLVPDLIEPGFFRFVIENDWTSSGPIEFDWELDVDEKKEPRPDAKLKGRVANLETDAFEFSLPASVNNLMFLLVWENDWTRFPTHDIDLIVAHFNAAGALDLVSFQGATLDSPERTTLSNIPDGGTWLVLVDGFTVFAEDNERYEVRIFFG